MKTEFPISSFAIILILMLFAVILFNKGCEQEEEKRVKEAVEQKEKEGPIYKLSERDEIVNSPTSYLKLTPKSWRKDGFGVVSIQNFDIENTSSIDMQDISIKFTYYSESGTELSSSIETVYKKVRAKSKIKVREFNAGFINQQTESCRLELVKAIPIVLYD